MKQVFIFLQVVLFVSVGYSQPVDLFNGKDLSGWDTFLPKTGLNNDPKKIFSVVDIDGKPAMKISGEEFGGVSTVSEYADYHLTVEFRWGQAKYAPKLNDKRDSGLLYHGVGEHGAGDGYWLRSQEFQVQEGDCGDYWGVAGGSFDIPVMKKDKNYIYSANGDMFTFNETSALGRHVIKSPDAEKPSGQWNTLELYCFGDSAIHVVNGVVVMKLYRSNLKKGKIQFQSEGAEVYYRNIKIEKITKMPAIGQ